MSGITVISDPAFEAALAKLRDRSLKPSTVRKITAELSSIVSKGALSPPPAAGEKIAIIVVLRSGLAMMEPFIESLPEDTDMVIYHLGLFRERQTLQPVEYYNKLPRKPANIKRAVILDPLIATGGTATAAVSLVKSWGVEQVTFLALIGSKIGLENASSVWPEGAKFIVGHQDGNLDSKGYVQPGVGDIGDRLFGTALE